MECIDLRRKFGRHYVIDNPAQGRGDDPWLYTIPCQRGHIYPHSDKLLGFASNSRGFGLRVAAIPGCEVWQEGSDGVNLVFPPTLFPKVAALVLPKRVRGSAARRQETIERLTPHRFGA